MDLTPKYVKMCEKAGEIQESWQFEDGDFYLHSFPDKEGQFVGKEVVMTLCPSCNVKDSHGDTYISEYSPKGENIYLPHQGQLQAMVEEVNDKNQNRLWRFFQWIYYAHYLPITHQCPNIHFLNLLDRDDIEGILWLAFVMKEKFNKIWDEEKEEWIKKA